MQCLLLPPLMVPAPWTWPRHLKTWPAWRKREGWKLGKKETPGRATKADSVCRERWPQRKLKKNQNKTRKVVSSSLYHILSSSASIRLLFFFFFSPQNGLSMHAYLDAWGIYTGLKIIIYRSTRKPALTRPLREPPSFPSCEKVDSLRTWMTLFNNKILHF